MLTARIGLWLIATSITANALYAAQTGVITKTHLMKMNHNYNVEVIISKWYKIYSKKYT